MRIDFFRNKAGVWERTFQVLLVDPNNTYITMGATIVKAHQQAVLLKHINKQFVGRGAKPRLWSVPEDD